MVGKFLVPLLVAVVGSLALLIPYLQKAYILFNLHRDFHLDTPHLDTLSKTCTLSHPTQLIGCEDMVLIGSSIFTACVTDARNFHKWGRSPTENISHITADAVYRWDLDTDTVTELMLDGFPTTGRTAAERSFLGMDVNERTDGSLSIYIINLLPSGNVIDKFHFVPGTDVLKHITRIMTSGPDAARVPNGVFALPEADDESAMYVTNDHYYGHGIMQAVEMYARLPWSWVSFYSKSTGWKKVLSGGIGVNGITGDKGVAGRKIYVSELGDGAIRVLEPTDGKAGAEGGVREVQKIDIGVTGDNPSLYNGDLYIPGVARAYLFSAWKKAPRGEKPFGLFEGGPGFLLKRINTRQIGTGFYGEGYTAAPVVEELISDGFGRMVNVSSTAVFRPYVKQEKAQKEVVELGSDGNEEADEEVAEEEVKTKGDLYITGIASRGIWRCENFE